MKNFLIITALILPIGMFAQGLNTNFSPPAQVSQMQNANYYDQVENDSVHKKTPCNDCDEVKDVIKANRSSSGSKSFGMKKWINKFPARMNRKIKKVFSHRKKVRTNYEICKKNN